MRSATLEERKKRVKKMIVVLKKRFPDAKISLRYSSNWELLVAVMLSQQCTDKKVNEVTSRLFKKYKTLDDYVRAIPSEFEKDIFETGFYRNKTKHILAAARMVKEKFRGRMPKTMTDMLAIPGVARKTANVVLGNAYGVVEGIAVDTHVRRIALKFDLATHDDPVRIERQLMEIIPKKDWFLVTSLFIEYGRKVCPARKHDCKSHFLTKLYKKAENIWP